MNLISEISLFMIWQAHYLWKLVMTVVIILLDQIPVINAPMLLIVNANDIEVEKTIDGIVTKYCKKYTVKSRNIVDKKVNLVIELRIKEQGQLVSEVSALENVTGASLLSHDGEVTY